MSEIPNEHRREKFELQELPELLISLDGLLFYLVHQSSFWLYGTMSPIESLSIRLGSDEIICNHSAFLHSLTVSGMTSARSLFHFLGIRRGRNDKLVDSLPKADSGDYLLERHYHESGIKLVLLERIAIHVETPMMGHHEYIYKTTFEKVVASFLRSALTEFIHATERPSQYAIADTIVACVILKSFMTRAMPIVSPTVNLESTRVWTRRLLPAHGLAWLNTLENNTMNAIETANRGGDSTLTLRFLVG